jgi:hypothetical protein
MVKRAYLTEAPAPPGRGHSIVSQRLLLKAIAVATSIENGGYRLGKIARKYPQLFVFGAIGVGLFAASRGARSRK